MTDERLREAERRWRETGLVEDRATYLQARLRAGELRRDLLELSAYCENAAARACLADDAPQAYEVPRQRPGNAWDPLPMESFRAFCRRLLEASPEALVQAAVASGWHVLPRFEAVRGDDQRPRKALQLADRCVAGAPDARDSVDRIADAALLAAQSTLPEGGLGTGAFVFGGSPPAEGAVAELAAYVCRLACVGLESVGVGETWDDVLNNLIELLGGSGAEWCAVASAMADRVGEWAIAGVPTT